MADRYRIHRAKRRILNAPRITLSALGCAIAATIAFPPRPLLVWNASASAPIGLYGVAGPDGIRKGDMVIARLREPYRSLAAERHYLPANVPLVKRVAALAGDRVCAHGSAIFVNGKLMNETTESTVTSGKIGFQCEGAEFEVRKVYIEPLKP